MKDKKSLKWLFNIFKKNLGLMIFLILMNAVLAGFGVVYIFVTKTLINCATAKETESFFIYIGVLFAVFAVQLAIRAVVQSVTVKIQSKLEISLKTRAMESIMRKDYTRVSAFHSGELITRLTGDTQIVSDNIVNFLPGIVSLVTRLVLASVFLIYIDARFSLVFLIAGIMLLIVNGIVRPFMKKLHKDVLEKDGKIRSLFLEVIDSLIMVKVFKIEDKIGEKSAQRQNDHYKSKMKRRIISIFANSAFSFVFQLGYLFALGWSAYNMLIIAAVPDFGSFTAVIQLVNQIQSPFASLSGILPKYYAIIASAERLRELEELPDEQFNELPEENCAELYDALTSLNIENVSFSYGSNTILENAELSVEKGEFAVISGISGIGKSTLFKLILGVINPSSGEVYFQKQNGRKVAASKNTRGIFAYVPQGNLLMSGTVRDSVSLVNNSVTDEEIYKALEIACAKDFIDALPDGLDSLLGEKGHGLSEGQIQRLAIARAIVSKAPILLFDEATSALDEETEERLLLNLKAQKNKTLILISHKKAAYGICSKEIKIEDKKFKVAEL